MHQTVFQRLVFAGQPNSAGSSSGWDVAMTRQVVGGLLAAVGSAIALGAAMFPLRSYVGIAASGLILVVPVIIGFALGGRVAGIFGIVTGVLVYDYVFIPPYGSLAVAETQGWVTLGIYVVVTTIVARVVVNLNTARKEARVNAFEARRLFDVSDLLVRESSLDELLKTIVTTVLRAFDLDGVALFLPVAERLELVESAGKPLSDVERRQLSTYHGTPVALESGAVPQGGVQAVALVASGRAIGLLALRGLHDRGGDRDLLRTFANHLALALERAQLREQAVRAQLLEEVDRLRRSLVGAVSHDLRTPLATIKVATSTLLDPHAIVMEDEVEELLRLVDLQADRLNRMVSNVLDMTRIQSGALELRRRVINLKDLYDDAFAVLGPLAELDRVSWHAPPDLPSVEVDQVLVCQVLANLIDNATRYSPEGTPVTVSAARVADDTVEVVVADQGPGVPGDERTSIFELFNRREAGGRGGLGLAIARAFIEAHGQRIWVADDGKAGARFVFTLPAAILAEVA
jgi:two-component system, OmpR family, sensor histidine kinase KdpD